MAKENLSKVFMWTFTFAYLLIILTIVGYGYYKEHEMDGNIETPDDQAQKLNSSLPPENITKEEKIMMPISSTEHPLNVTKIPEVLQQLETKNSGTTIKPLGTKGESRNNQTLGSPHSKTNLTE